MRGTTAGTKSGSVTDCIGIQTVRLLICDTFPNTTDGRISDDQCREANQRFLAALLLCTSHNLEKSVYMTVITETDGAPAKIRWRRDNGPNAWGNFGGNEECRQIAWQLRLPFISTWVCVWKQQKCESFVTPLLSALGSCKLITGWDEASDP